MNILVDTLPSKVYIDNIEYEINTNFSCSILFELIIQDEELSNEDKIYKALELYYPTIPLNLDGAINKILWFYQCGKDLRTSKCNSSSNKKSKQIYSFKYDAEYIYAAFLDQFGIDLQDVEYLHWWKFKAMFNSLRSDNKIVEIMGYRAIDITNDMTKEQKDFYNRMKKEYEIPISKNEKEKISAIEEALLKGEDISKLL